MGGEKEDGRGKKEGGRRVYRITHHCTQVYEGLVYMDFDKTVMASQQHGEWGILRSS